MARPQKQGLDFFSHDTDASYDKKIQKLITRFGLAGTGFYYGMLEQIYASPSISWHWSEDDRAILCRLWRISSATFQRMLDFCLEIQLFDLRIYQTSAEVTSASIKERAAFILRKREAMRAKRNEGVCGPQTPPQTGEQTREQTGESTVPLQNNNLTSKEPTNPLPPSVVVVLREYEKTIGALDEATRADILKAIDYHGESEVKKCIRIAKQAKILNWKYIAGILKKRNRKRKPRGVERYLGGKYGHLVRH